VVLSARVAAARLSHAAGIRLQLHLPLLTACSCHGHTTVAIADPGWNLLVPLYLPSLDPALNFLYPEFHRQNQDN
jgi:hypothetical protein